MSFTGGYINKSSSGVDGKSAYEIAVENGFEGSEQEWLESLKGKDGIDGTDGKSAYEIALDNGFEGTEQEWLESLKGKDGIDGADGSDGEPGQDGTDGRGIVNITYDAEDNLLVFHMTDGTTISVDYPTL